jgi:hypothetical protein
MGVILPYAAPVALPITDLPYRGHAPVTWDTQTLKRVIDELNALGVTVGAGGAGAKGVVGWKIGSPAVSVNNPPGEAQVMTTYADVISGRMYECALMNITADISGTDATEFGIRYTTDGSVPTNASPEMAISLRISQFKLAAIRILYGAPANQRLYIRAAIKSLTPGQTVRSWCPGVGAILMINDVGVTPGQTGSAP